MNAANSGCGRSGRLLNSGWAWVATKNGCRSGASSTYSTSRPSGEVPEQIRPALLELRAVAVVHLVAVAVAFVDDLFVAVRGAGARAGQQPGRPRAEPHRAAHVDDVALLVHEIDDRMRRARVELAGVGARRGCTRRARTR